MMKRKLLILTTFIALAAALTVLLSGCAGSKDPTEGKNIVTFEINGGILSYGTSSTDGRINYAYQPGTYIKDPAEFPNYKIYRNGHNFTGWYTSKDCKPDEKWDFSKPFEMEQLTLYAGWEVALKYTYSVNYTDGENTVTLGVYDKVLAGDKFDDWKKFADEREGYTASGYFSDPECTVPWDFSKTHPGGSSDLDIPVYVKYIEGTWKLVSSFDQLNNALKSGSSVYLMNDIDCGGAELYVSGSFGEIFEGNGYKVTNFTVTKKGTTFNPSLAIFNKLDAGAELRNVSFENASYQFFDIADHDSVRAKVAALAVSIEDGVKVSDVSISGTLETNYSAELPCLNKVFYYTNVEDEALLNGVTDFDAEITIVNP